MSVHRHRLPEFGVGMGRKIEDFEDRTRGHPRGSLVTAFIGVHVLIGVVTTVTGTSVKEAWLAPLPVLLVVGAGIGTARARRRWRPARLGSLRPRGRSPAVPAVG